MSVSLIAIELSACTYFTRCPYDDNAGLGYADIGDCACSVRLDILKRLIWLLPVISYNLARP